MLPGFRFLLAAILLSMSLLIFGLGAAALLRAAHEEFASIPSRRPPPETHFAQRDDAGSTLAMLRVEPAAADQKATDPPKTSDAQDQPAIGSTPAEAEKPAAESDKVAVLTATPPETSPLSEATTSDAAAAEIPVKAKTRARADVPSSAAETKVAALAEMTPATSNEGAVTAAEQASAPADDSTKIAETRIATLGGPPVTIETQTPSTIAPARVKKSSHARGVVKRRRIAPARVTQRAPQTPADPFAQPFGR
jgi:hypothetical protein